MKLIAETAWHHDGDFIFFKDLVTQITENTNTDFIKLHITLDLDEYMSPDHPAYDWCKERLLTEQQWSEITSVITTGGKKIMLLFNDRKAIDFGMKYQPELIEIHSVCLNDIHLLEHLASSINGNEEIVLGVGGSDIYEIENAVNILNGKNIVLMHGFQNYPTQYHNVNLSKIKKIMQLYPAFKHGYADHTAWDNPYNEYVTLFGASLGMDYIEKHVTTSTGAGRTDWQAAISIDQFKELCSKIEILQECFGDGCLELNEGERSYSTFGANKKASILNKNIKEGHILSLDDFSFKRTGQSTDLSQIASINSVGKAIAEDRKEGDILTTKDFSK